MNCKTLHKKLIFFIEGDLPYEEMQEAEAHLDECVECAAFAEEMKKTLEVVQWEKQIPGTPFFYTRLKARMEKEQEETLPDRKSLVWNQIIQPAIFSFLLLIGVYTGIKIGSQANTGFSSSVHAETELIPFLNEMEAEPLETFLME